MVLIKNWQFFHLFIKSKIGQENVFENVLGRKKALPEYKNKKLKKSKIGIFPKALVHGFGQKMAIFLSFYCRQHGPGKCV